MGNSIESEVVALHGLKQWEIALVLALAATLLLGAVPGCAWWGAVYPELTPDMSARTVAAAAGGAVELRLRSLEWLRGALAALGLS